MEVADPPTLIALRYHEREARRGLDCLAIFCHSEHVKAGEHNGGIRQHQR
jgi:hypothetical protein